MYSIRADKEREDEKSSFFTVTVALGDNEYHYKVTLDSDYYQTVTQGKISPTELVVKAFHFLLDNEPPESILSSFNISIIKKYFPNFEKDVLSY